MFVWLVPGGGVALAEWAPHCGSGLEYFSWSRTESSPSNDDRDSDNSPSHLLTSHCFIEDKPPQLWQVSNLSMCCVQC